MAGQPGASPFDVDVALTLPNQAMNTLFAPSLFDLSPALALAALILAGALLALPLYFPTALAGRRDDSTRPPDADRAFPPLCGNPPATLRA
jgi:hypothetical protein